MSKRRAAISRQNLEEQAHLRLEDVQETPVHVKTDDYLAIALHQRHRVEWTSPGEPMIWFAVSDRASHLC